MLVAAVAAEGWCVDMMKSFVVLYPRMRVVVAW